MDQSLFPAPHGLTQGITSFIASCCQGIHQTPFSRLIRSRKSKTALTVGSILHPCHTGSYGMSVSVLDLTVSPAPGVPRGASLLGSTGDTDVFLSLRCQLSSGWTIKRSHGCA